MDIKLFITDPRNLFGAGSSFDFPKVIARSDVLLAAVQCAGPRDVFA